MTCLICRTKFWPQIGTEPAEYCDCGANLAAGYWREIDEPVNLDQLREAWRTTCERCLADGKRSAGVWSVEHNAHLCETHKQGSR